MTRLELATVLERAFPDCVVIATPPAPDADPITRLQSELAGMLTLGGLPAYWLPQLRREVIEEALDLLDGVEEYDQIQARPCTSELALELARDLFCMDAAERECERECAGE
jgi:hypothetical protein